MSLYIFLNYCKEKLVLKNQGKLRDGKSKKCRNMKIQLLNGSKICLNGFVTIEKR